MLDAALRTHRISEIERALAEPSSAERAKLRRELVERLERGGEPLLDRVALGHALGFLGDPRLDPLHPQMCRVPRGSFWMGIDLEDCEPIARAYGIPTGWMAKASPRHEVELDAYEIARFPVTQGEYARFLEATGLEPQGGDPAPPTHLRSHPVHGVSWQGALWYAEWVSQETGLHYRIPTEAEWEKAARGVDGRAFPWGERFDAARCNTREGGVGSTTPVGCYPAGASPYGVLDLAGNVEEQVADLYRPYPGSTLADAETGTYRITRGGVFCLDADLARCDRRHGTPHAGPTGFRLCRSAADEWLGRDPTAGPSKEMP